MGNYIDVARSFTKLETKGISDEDVEKYSSANRYHSHSWDTVIQSPVSIILSEGGAGKTEEMIQKSKALQKSGKFSFFLRLEHVSTGINHALEDSTIDKWNQWKSSSENCVIFLDSVDEARLGGPLHFETAIRSIKVELADHYKRATIILSARITEWRPSSDFNLVVQLFPHYQNQVLEDHSDDFSLPQNTQSASSTAVSFSEPKIIEASVYRLDVFDADQVRKFIKGRKVTDPEKLMEAIEKTDAWPFVGRPIELDDVIKYWVDHGKIGSRLEMIKSSINKRLIERTEKRKTANNLSLERAKSGAQSLASALTLQKKSRILTSSEASVTGVNPDLVLDESWSVLNVRSLLNLEVFDPETYGSVRFYHRSIREYLAASYFVYLLKNANSRNLIEGLFFKKIYGEEVIVPSLRPILSWVILHDDIIRERVAKIAPELLLQDGDPSELPTEIKSKFLKLIAEKIYKNADDRLNFTETGLRRFAKADLAETIRGLISKYKKSHELRHLLLQMIWRADIEDCADICMTIAVNSKEDLYSRCYALRAISSICDLAEQKIVKNKIFADKGKIDTYLSSQILTCIDPSLLSITDVLSILKRTTVEKFESSLSQAAYDVIRIKSDAEKLEYLQLCVNLLKPNEIATYEWYNVNKKYIWLLKTCGMVIGELLTSRNPIALNEIVLKSLSLISHVRDEDHRNIEGDFKAIISAWPAIRYALFWHEIQIRKFENNADALPQWYVANSSKSIWWHEIGDLENYVTFIANKTSKYEQLIALSVCATLLRSHNQKAKIESKILAAAKKVGIESYVAKYLHPKPSPEWKKHELMEKKYKMENEEREKKRANNKSEWIAWLKKNHKKLEDPSVASQGTIWSGADYLMRALREGGERNGRWSSGNWRSLIPKFGLKVAESLRTSAKVYWRHFTPALRSLEDVEENSIPLAVIYGLLGIQIEYQDTPSWTQSLSSNEAKLAIRYALYELNDFPVWFKELFQSFPAVSLEVMMQEINWELSNTPANGVMHYAIARLTQQDKIIHEYLREPLVNLLCTKSPKNDRAFENCLKIIFGVESKDKSKFSKDVKAIIKINKQDSRRAFCLAIWMRHSSIEALSELQLHLKSLNKQMATQFAMQFIVSLMGDKWGEPNDFSYGSFKTPEILGELYRLMNKHINPNQDIHRSGSYSPQLRDKAQDCRNRIYNLLCECSGKQAYIELSRIGDANPENQWMLKMARRRAELDSEFIAWHPTAVQAFFKSLVRVASNNTELHETVVLKLQDLKSELELSDHSTAKTWMKVSDENELRLNIANWLRTHNNNGFLLPEEEELANAQRPDIRIYMNSSFAPVPVELKLADRWTGKKLLERMKNQLCNDYLRDAKSENGVYLLVSRKKTKKWQRPRSRTHLDFTSLIEYLQTEADKYIVDKPKIKNITVLGINLTVRGMKSGKSSKRKKPDSKVRESKTKRVVRQNKGRREK